MKHKFRIACVALLATAAVPAWALQLGQVEVKSALNQPLVAVIPLQPKNLTELDGLSVGLAPEQDFARAGLQLTPTDQTLQFHVVTDNNGQKLILVTSSQAVTDPYLDFLVQVNTHQGKQVREFVVLLNPVVTAPAPGVQAAPVASAQVGQPTELPPSSAFPQPSVQSAPKPAAPVPQAGVPTPPPQPQAASAGDTIPVARGNTLYGIAQQQTRGTHISINQMMLALKAANPEAFFKNNINDLKAGAILRIPTRDEIDKLTIAEANAEVHRQYETWRASRPHPETVVEGTATQAAANAAPEPGSQTPTSDHLALVPPTGKAGGTSNRPGVAGGTGSETVAGLQQQLQNDRDSLISLNQSNADLESRVRSLKDISDKSDELMSLKDATIAELQRKLSAIQSGHTGVGVAASAAAPMPTAKMTSPAQPATPRPKAPPSAPWFARPVVWVVAGLFVLTLILLGLLRRRRRGGMPPGVLGPLPDDPEDLVAGTDDETALQKMPLEQSEPETPAEIRDFYSVTGLRQPIGEDATMVRTPAASGPIPVAQPESVRSEPSLPAPSEPIPAVAAPAEAQSKFNDDPVDTKLDLARAYLDMGDPVGAHAMLEEVLEEGSQMQKDEAKRLLAEVAG